MTPQASRVPATDSVTSTVMLPAWISALRSVTAMSTPPASAKSAVSRSAPTALTTPTRNQWVDLSRRIVSALLIGAIVSGQAGRRRVGSAAADERAQRAGCEQHDADGDSRPVAGDLESRPERHGQADQGDDQACEHQAVAGAASRHVGSSLGSESPGGGEPHPVVAVELPVERAPRPLEDVGADREGHAAAHQPLEPRA